MPALSALGLLTAALAAAPRGEIVLAPAAARPGDAVLVRVRGGGTGPEPSGSLGDLPLRFWRKGGELWAIAGLPIETPPGPVPVEIAWEGPRPRRASATLEIVEPRFRSRTLTVAARYVEPPAEVAERIAADQAAFQSAYARPFVPPLFTKSFGWPRRASTNGRYGDQRILNGTKTTVHYGLDIRGPRGAAVFASNDGEVVLARDCYYSGKTVVIWHGADVFTLYFHLDRIAVRAGAKVRKGQRIGSLGSTGRSTGPHLHWSVRIAGLLVDPESLLAMDFERGEAPPRKAPAPPREAPVPAAPPERTPIAREDAPPTAAPSARPAAAPSPSPRPEGPAGGAANVAAPPR